MFYKDEEIEGEATLMLNCMTALMIEVRVKGRSRRLGYTLNEYGIRDSMHDGDDRLGEG